MEHSQVVSLVERLHTDAFDRRLFFQNCESDILNGRVLHANGRELVSFTSCSYLGLEFRPELVEGVCDAVRRFGTQFSSSRGYLSAPGYAELESLLSTSFGAPTLVTPTTTLGHLAVFDALITEKDAVILDHQVHASVQKAAVLAQGAGTHVEVVRHEELEKTIELAQRLGQTHSSVWFCTDGVTSMYGDHAPIPLITHLLERVPNLRLYIDDAHGSSWAGRHGAGWFSTQLPFDERMVIALSLNKSFAAAGGAFVLPAPGECDKVRMCGGTMLFSGPIQPPMLGAAIASAKLHRSPLIVDLQMQLRDRVRRFNRLAAAAELPLLVENDTPIQFLCMGQAQVAKDVAQLLLERHGDYVNVSMFPTVPMRRSGIRIALTAVHSEAQIDHLVEGLADVVPEVFARHGISQQELEKSFERAVVGNAFAGTGRRIVRPLSVRRQERLPVANGSPHLHLQETLSIADIDRETWNAALGSAGCCSWDAMAAAERIFRNREAKEHNWDFRYFIVRDEHGKPVCVTFVTVALQKDDMLMRSEVSVEVERRRVGDPYFLTSKVVMVGSVLSEGQHLWVDRSGSWQAALQLVIDRVYGIYDEVEGDAIMIREFPSDDAELDDHLLHAGFVKVPTLTSYKHSVDWADAQEFIAKQSKKRRRVLRKVAASADKFRVEYFDQDRREEILFMEQKLNRLYLNVAQRKYRLNVFQLPSDLFAGLLATPAWELGVLWLSNDAGEEHPVAFFAAHKHGSHYSPLVCGLDYDFVYEHDVYRQMLFQMLLRGKELGCDTIHLGMDADLEKRRMGCVGQDCCVYVHARENFGGAIMRKLVADVGFADENTEATAPVRESAAG